MTNVTNLLKINNSPILLSELMLKNLADNQLRRLIHRENMFKDIRNYGSEDGIIPSLIQHVG
jgi:hypothetical protein